MYIIFVIYIYGLHNRIFRSIRVPISTKIYHGKHCYRDFRKNLNFPLFQHLGVQFISYMFKIDSHQWNMHSLKGVTRKTSWIYPEILILMILMLCKSYLTILVFICFLCTLYVIKSQTFGKCWQQNWCDSMGLSMIEHFIFSFWLYLHSFCSDSLSNICVGVDILLLIFMIFIIGRPDGWFLNLTSFKKH